MITSFVYIFWCLSVEFRRSLLASVDTTDISGERSKIQWREANLLLFLNGKRDRRVEKFRSCWGQDLKNPKDQDKSQLLGKIELKI